MRIREGGVIGGPRMLTGAIPRARLMSMLENGAPLTVVRAMCGTGKTVTVRVWAESTAPPVVWITVDASTAAPEMFVTAILRRLARLGVRIEDVVPRHPWAALRSALQDIDGELVLVVDNAEIAEEATLVELCRLISSQDALRVIAIENRSTVLDRPGAALLADRSEIGPIDLLLDEHEIAQVLAVAPDVAQRVHAATSGLPVLVDALAKRGYHSDDQTVFDEAIDAVEDYLRLRTLRANYDPLIIDTLVRVSVAGIMNAELAVSLSGNPHASDVLDTTESFGFGTWSRRGAERLFELTPFARVLLLRELKRRRPGELTGLRRVVAEWLLARASPMEALHLAVVDEDFDLAIRVARANWLRLLSEHRSSVRELLGAVSLPRLRDWPLLVMLLSMCMIEDGETGHHARQLFRRAASVTNSVGADVEDSDQLFVWTAESSALRAIGMREQAGRVAVRALTALTDMPDDERESHAGELPLVCAQLGMSLYYGGHRHQAVECFAFGAALAHTANLRNALGCLAMLSGIHALNGDMPEARRYIDLTRAGPWVKADVDGHHGTFHHVAEALLALEESDLARASEHVAVLAPHGPTSEHWLAIAHAQAQVAIRLDRAALGRIQLESLAASRGREGRSGAARKALATTRAVLHLALGDTAQAAAVLEHDGGNGLPAHVARARLELSKSRPAAALRHLADRPLARISPRIRANALAVRAAALLRLGGEEAAAGDLAELSAVLQDRELRDPLALLPPEELRLTVDALNKTAPCDWGTIASALPIAASPSRLSAGEARVVLALMREPSIAAVASGIGVSPNTVKTQLKSIYRKLGVSGRDEAIATAVSRGLLIEHERIDSPVEER